MSKYTANDFLKSLRPSANSKKLNESFDKTSGRGGCPLFSTEDKKFIIKQIKETEKNILLSKFLLPFCKHITKCSSLITKILGVFSIKIK